MYIKHKLSPHGVAVLRNSEVVRLQSTRVGNSSLAWPRWLKLPKVGKVRNSGVPGTWGRTCLSQEWFLISLPVLRYLTSPYDAKTWRKKLPRMVRRIALAAPTRRLSLAQEILQLPETLDLIWKTGSDSLGTRQSAFPCRSLEDILQEDTWIS